MLLEAGDNGGISEQYEEYQLNEPTDEPCIELHFRGAVPAYVR